VYAALRNKSLENIRNRKKKELALINSKNNKVKEKILEYYSELTFKDAKLMEQIAPMLYEELASLKRIHSSES